MESARSVAATTPETEIKPGSPAEAYQAIFRARMLWGFRKRDFDGWEGVIRRWTNEPKAWHRIPEFKPYGTARKMIEAEVCPDYDAFYAFIEAVLGSEWAIKLADNYGEHGGLHNPAGNNQHTESGQGYARNLDLKSEALPRGNRKTYLSERIAKEYPDEVPNIGKGKKYKTVHEAARKLGIVGDRDRLCVYADDPEAAGRYLAERVDADWWEACKAAFEAHAGRTAQ